MKNKIIILLIALFIGISNINAQYFTFNVKYKDSTYSFKYSPILKKHLDEYFGNANKMKLDLSNLEKLDGILWSNNIFFYTRPLVGITPLPEAGENFILISDNIPKYLPTFINAVVYHELSHFIMDNNKHCISGCPYILQEGKYINIEKVICSWNNIAKIEYFMYLKLKMKK